MPSDVHVGLYRTSQTPKRTPPYATLRRHGIVSDALGTSIHRHVDSTLAAVLSDQQLPYSLVSDRSVQALLLLSDGRHEVNVRWAARHLIARPISQVTRDGH
jgi:hypothetical protein